MKNSKFLIEKEHIITISQDKNGDLQSFSYEDLDGDFHTSTYNKERGAWWNDNDTHTIGRVTEIVYQVLDSVGEHPRLINQLKRDKKEYGYLPSASYVFHEHERYVPKDWGLEEIQELMDKIDKEDE